MKKINNIHGRSRLTKVENKPNTPTNLNQAKKSPEKSKLVGKIILCALGIMLGSVVGLTLKEIAKKDKSNLNVGSYADSAQYKREYEKEMAPTHTLGSGGQGGTARVNGSGVAIGGRGGDGSAGQVVVQEHYDAKKYEDSVKMVEQLEKETGAVGLSDMVEENRNQESTISEPESKRLIDIIKDPFFYQVVTFGFGIYAAFAWFIYFASFNTNEALTQMIKPTVATFLAFKWSLILQWLGL